MYHSVFFSLHRCPTTTAFQFYLITPARNLVLFTGASPPLFPDSGNHSSLKSLWSCLFWTFHIDGILWYVVFGALHLSTAWWFQGLSTLKQVLHLFFYCWSIFRICPSISWWPSPCCCCYLAAKLYLTPANPWTVAHQVSERIVEWGAMSFSRESSQPRVQTWVSCLAGRFFFSLKNF